MNSQKVKDELKERFDLRAKWRVLRVATPEDLEILNDACRTEWNIITIHPDHIGGMYYTLKRGG